jgi:hypothetical protein
VPVATPLLSLLTLSDKTQMCSLGLGRLIIDRLRTGRVTTEGRPDRAKMRENDTLLNSRFEAASRARLGSRDDTKAILKAIRDQMSPLRPLKPEIRWPSPEVVIRHG